MNNQIPWIGASVKIAGTQQGITTVNDGSFTINATKGQTLEVTYIGKIDEKVVVGNNSSISITLKDETASSLNDVVVVGYGTQVKKDLTGSIGVVPQSKMGQPGNGWHWTKSTR
jgi:hypothetical protein